MASVTREVLVKNRVFPRAPTIKALEGVFDKKKEGNTNKKNRHFFNNSDKNNIFTRQTLNFATMNKKILLFVLMIGAIAYSCQEQKQDLPPLIDREVFFDDPQITGSQLSPDGAYISFLSPYEDTRNIWIKTREASFEEAIPVTAVTERPIMGYFWSRDGKYLLYVMDK